MKKLILSLLTLFCSVGSYAQLGADGFYRVKNVKIKDGYIVVVDNHGAFNAAQANADVAALWLKKGFDSVVDDPASVIYVKNNGGGKYSLKAQGCSTDDIIGSTGAVLKIIDNNDGTYSVYGAFSGASKYLGGVGMVDHYEVQGMNYSVDRCDWIVNPMSSDAERFFGLKPQVTVGAQHYATLFADFAFTPTAGMTVNYVSEIDDELAVAVYEPITGVVPARCPVFFSLPSAEASGNKLDLLTAGPAAPANKLKGVYFENTSEGLHHNVTAFNKQTMRVLGETKSGKLGFVKASLTNVPRNRAYLELTGSKRPNELVLMTPDEYAEYKASGIVELTADTPATGIRKGTYTLNGVRVDGTNPNRRGLYIVDGKKVFK